MTSGEKKGETAAKETEDKNKEGWCRKTGVGNTIIRGVFFKRHHNRNPLRQHGEPGCIDTPPEKALSLCCGQINPGKQKEIEMKNETEENGARRDGKGEAVIFC